jgi:hypothetical protein
LTVPKNGIKLRKEYRGEIRMKKLFIVMFFLITAFSFGQQKFALVIGNGAYTGSGVDQLKNPVNDANDIAAALQSLGFTVDKQVDANLDQMEKAIIRFKNRLSASNDTYGFLFYAGYGVQSGGVNYLIPVGANIPTENSLRDRAVSVQRILGELNSAGNALNVVVLDACRDNPFSWKRSGSQGLTPVGNQPIDSIIVFPTRAGSTTADETGRNGLFASYLLYNLKTPGLAIDEVFKRTGADVSRASNKTQIPAIYNHFFETAYLGSRPLPGMQPSFSVQPALSIQPASASQPVPDSELRPADNKTYKIGDRGPAGGIVFYDKGTNTDGWQYLEVAPKDLGDAEWGTYGKEVVGTGMAVGTGKRNTQLIVERLKALGENGRAAQLCASLNINGFTDWFLPSHDELELLYKNVSQKGLGGFGGGWYWSSSQHDSKYSLGQKFNDGRDANAKNYKGAVRAVRAF